ncbi:RNA polymerase sigma factor [candidate division KSB1 bacterium]|nr:RNA polymerase sigma factor [candidate division KSB1 bacterium]
MNNTISDEELVKRVSLDDHKAEDLILTRYGPRIDALVRNRIGYNNDDWEDIAQEIKKAVVCGIREGNYKSEKGSLAAWICGTARNQTIKYFRQKKIAPKNIDTVPESYLAREDYEYMEREEMVNAVKVTINELPEKYKNVLVLKYIEVKRPKEISKQLKIPLDRVYEFSNYAMTLIRKKLKERDLFQDYSD